YHDTVQALFATYTDLLPQVIAAVQRDQPRRAGQTERGYEAACRAQALDLLRYLLPASTLTNIGMTINGRALEHLLTKMLSHPLPEVRRTGAMIKEEARQIIPTLLKYAERSPYLADTDAAIHALAQELLAPDAPQPQEAVRLI